MNLKKSAADIKKEKDDMVSSKLPILRYLKYQDELKFKIGDILVKKSSYEDENGKIIWETETDQIGIPVQYVYIFENEVGVGYVKRLKPDGSGPTRATAICIARFDAGEHRFVLDPGYAEHLLLGEGDYQYHKDRERLTTFRNEAIEKNKQLLIDTSHKASCIVWWKSLKIGDTIYVGYGPDDVGDTVFKILSIGKDHKKLEMETIYDANGVFDPSWSNLGQKENWSRTNFVAAWDAISTKKPYSLKEDGV